MQWKEAQNQGRSADRQLQAMHTWSRLPAPPARRDRRGELPQEAIRSWEYQNFGAVPASVTAADFTKDHDACSGAVDEYGGQDKVTRARWPGKLPETRTDISSFVESVRISKECNISVQ